MFAGNMAFQKGNKFAQGLTESGRPPTFENTEKLKAAIDDYFNNGISKRTVIIGKGDNKQEVEIEIPTITGLCLWIGFESRQSFYDYEKRDEFSYIVKRARLFIENEYEEHLTAGNTVGAIFALKNMGWADRQEIVQETTFKQSFKIGDKEIEF